LRYRRIISLPMSPSDWTVPSPLSPLIGGGSPLIGGARLGYLALSRERQIWSRLKSPEPLSSPLINEATSYRSKSTSKNFDIQNT
jgi:hypothetical protein